ncbi:phage tail protein [Pseudochryseolinea flava]|uniref:Glycerol acyltransferase n=1 Tax=Pseudochryseolinea flava TaxID=2059302 RepID=A0A364Y6X7_9BACT|nr:phage tail protein [Pseudochryseolinea flava]RAW01594.1 glycerol acyltransferase [Pseudochryseolinea flava]
MAEYYPPVGFHFKVEVNLPDIAQEDREVRFQEVGGLNKTLEIEEFKEGGENRFAHRLPNPAKYANLVLKRGMLTKSKLINWCFDAIDNFDFKPADITITLLDEKHNPLSVWNISKAYPVKWLTTDLKAQENAIVIETLELAYQYFTKSDQK